MAQPATKRTRADISVRRATSTTSEQLYESYASEFLKRVRQATPSMMGKPFERLSQEEILVMKDKLIKTGEYDKILSGAVSELNTVEGADTVLGKKMGDPASCMKKKKALIMLFSERAALRDAMKSRKFGEVWTNMISELIDVMNQGPNKDKYKGISSGQNLNRHIKQAFEKATDVSDFIRKVLKHDSVAFHMGGEAVVHEAVDMTGKKLFGSGEIIPNFGFKLISPVEHLPAKYGAKYAKAVVIGERAILPFLESATSLKVLPEVTMQGLGFSSTESQKLATGQILESLKRAGGVISLLKRITPEVIKAMPPPFAGRIVPSSALGKLKTGAGRVKGATAVALFAVSAVLAYALMEKEQKKARESGLGGAVPKKVK